MEAVRPRISMEVIGEKRKSEKDIMRNGKEKNRWKKRGKERNLTLSNQTRACK